MKKTQFTGAVVILIILLGILFLFNKYRAGQKENLPSNQPGTEARQQPSSPISSGVTQYGSGTKPFVGSQGRVILGIADKAVDIGSIDKIIIVVREIMAHSAAKGWISVSKTLATYDLLKLHLASGTELLADVNLSAGTYDQIRLLVDKVTVYPKAGNQQDAKLPSGDIKLNANLIVEKGKISSIVLDFLADESLHITGDGKYIFAPIIKIESKSEVSVQITAKNEKFPHGKLDVFDGYPKFIGTLGMDERGDMQLNGGLSPLTNLQIVNNVLVILPPGQDQGAVKISAESALSAAINSGNIDSAITLKIMARDGKQVWQIIGKKGHSVVVVYVDASTGSVVGTE